LKDKEQKSLDPRRFLPIRKEILRKFHGLTMTSIAGNPVYRGFWKSPDTKTIIEDVNSIFTVLTPRTDENISDITSFDVKGHLILPQLQFYIHFNHCW
jgi:hypothetical protein